LNKTLFTTIRGGKWKTFDTFSGLDDKAPNYKTKDFNLYFRQGRNELLDFLFMKNRGFFEIAVWSSLDKDFTSTFTKLFFERYYRNLMFISATKREEYEGIKDHYSPEPIPIRRDLNQIFQKFPEFDMNNVVVVSTEKNMMDLYTANDLLVKPYDPSVQGFKIETDFTFYGLTKFLRGIRFMTEKKKIEDVRAILGSKSLDHMLDRIENTTMNYTKTV